LRPNDIQLEQDVTVDVANAATAANLKTAKLFKDQATRPEMHEYLACPRVRAFSLKFRIASIGFTSEAVEPVGR